MTECWLQELDEIRLRIIETRRQFADQMRELTGSDRFDFVTRQRGMFGFLGISPEQVARLKREHAIYALKSGRINVAGLNTGNMNSVCRAIQHVL